MFHPGLFLVLLVADLVHHIEGIAAVGDNGLIEAHGVLDGVQGIGDVFFGDADFRCDLLNGGFLEVLSGQVLLGVDGFVGGVFQGAGDTHGTVVPEETADLSDDHGHCIGGKFYLQGSVEIVSGLDEPDAADLEKVIHIFIAGGESFDDAQNQAQVPFNVCLPCFAVPGFYLLEEGFLFFCLQQREF